jgi:hypothetical protein
LTPQKSSIPQPQALKDGWDFDYRAENCVSEEILYDLPPIKIDPSALPSLEGNEKVKPCEKDTDKNYMCLGNPPKPVELHVRYDWDQKSASTTVNRKTFVLSTKEYPKYYLFLPKNYEPLILPSPEKKYWVQLEYLEKNVLPAKQLLKEISVPHPTTKVWLLANDNIRFGTNNNAIVSELSEIYHPNTLDWTKGTKVDMLFKTTKSSTTEVLVCVRVEGIHFSGWWIKPEDLKSKNVTEDILQKVPEIDLSK